MLQMRARAFALRDIYADVLGGLYLREEIEDAVAEPRQFSARSGAADRGLTDGGRKKQRFVPPNPWSTERRAQA
jgi:hypothetical protein